MRAERIHRNPEASVASNHPELHATGFAISIEYHGGLFVAAALVQLEKSAGLFIDLAHRN
jgi:hypothetical protein